MTARLGLGFGGDLKDRLRFSLRQSVQVWGVLGIVTMMLAFSLAAFAIVWILPAAHRLVILEARSLEPTSIASLPTAITPITETTGLLDGFYKSFPPDGLVLDITGQINQVADQSGMRISQADYRVNQDLSGLIRYEVSLSAHGTYPQLRRFTAACLTYFPTLSLDSLALSRSTVTDSTIDAQFRFSIYFAATSS